ncbi:MAG: pitrilysin family protein [Cyanobacteria bacterium J06632_22]
MTFLTTAACILALVLSWAGPAAAVTPQHYTDLDFPTLGDINIPDYERYELDNGMVVYLMENHDLPLVSGGVTLRTGTALDPTGQIGLGSITGEAMRLGGTANHPPAELNELLEQRAASVETSLGTTSGGASFSALAEDLDPVFELFADVLRNPAFAPDKFELIKSRYRGDIARRNDDPDDITGREFRKLVYGDESPYARQVEYSDLDNISRDDVIAFYNANITPQNSILSISGDFETTQMKTLIEQRLGAWQPAAETAFSAPTETQAKTGLYLIDQPQLTQSYIQIGHLGGRLDNPDHAPLVVLNEVLNGFGGRLFNDIRSRQGLAYVVYAFWSPRYDYPGLFIGGGQTRSEATVPFLQSIQAEIERVREEPISETELQFAKDSVLNSFVFNFATPEQSLSRLVRYEYHGYPSDFVFRFREQVEATTADEVLAAAQENLKPEDLITLVVGNQAEITPPLESLGGVSVTPIDISIPGEA